MRPVGGARPFPQWEVCFVWNQEASFYFLLGSSFLRKLSWSVSDQPPSRPCKPVFNGLVWHRHVMSENGIFAVVSCWHFTIVRRVRRLKAIR